MSKLPLGPEEGNQLMVAVREWGTWIRRETRHLYSGKPDSIEKHLFAAGRADAAYLEVIRLVRGEKAAEALEAAVMLREDVTESRRTS